MKQKFLVIAALAALVACNQSKSGGKENSTPVTNPAKDSVQAAINSVLDHHTAAVNSYDAKGSAEMFSDDANIIEYSQETKRMTGRTQIDSTIALECEAFKKDKIQFEAKWTTHALRLVNNMAFQDASIVFNMKIGGGEPVAATADAYLSWKKSNDNHWKVHTMVLYAH